MTETFVHGDIEVRKTGRIAERVAPGGKKSILVEITPANEYDGTWKKWVNPSTLFSIIDPEQQYNNKKEK